MAKKEALQIAAIGDLAFCGRFTDCVEPSALEQVKKVLGDTDIVIGNLEGPLTLSCEPVPGKCPLRGHPAWSQVLKNAGISIVSLANNHTMDFGSAGLEETLSSLKGAGIKVVGAGRSREEANAPIFLEIKGQKLAVFARTMVHVASPSYAGDKVPGVAFFDENEALSTVVKCKEEADLVILLIHWGLEEYTYPSPGQRILAQRLVQAGVDLILGHHPHVLQGVEKNKNSYIVYSLGNFLFDDFEWTATTSEGKESLLAYRLNPANREGMIAFFEINENSEVELKKTEFTVLLNNGSICVDSLSTREESFDKCCRFLKSWNYSFFWRLYALHREWELRIKPIFFPEGWLMKLGKVRWHHVSRVAEKLIKSIKIATGKSSNPYD